MFEKQISNMAIGGYFAIMKTKFKKTLSPLLLIFLVFGIVFTYKFMFGKPFTLDQLYMRTFIKLLKDDPEVLSQLGLVNNSVFDFYSDDLTDVSPQQQKKVHKIYNNDLKFLRTYDTKNMNEEDKLSYDIFEWYLQNKVDGEKFMYHNYPVNQYEGVQNQVLEVLTSVHSITDKKSAKNYIERLSKVNSKFDGLIEGLGLRKEMGIIPPAFILQNVLEQTRDFISCEPENNILMSSFIKKLDNIKNLDYKEKDDLCRKVEYQIKNCVYPSYKKLIEYVEVLKESANDDAGVWKLPDGDKYYEYRVKSFTTTNLTPEQIHKIGIDEVARIENEMGEIINNLGYKDISPGEFMKKLSKDNKFKYNDTEEGRLTVIRDYKAAISEIEGNVFSCFDMRPRGGVEVEPVPEFKQHTSPLAYTIPVSSDGSRPSTLYINLGKMDDILNYNIKSLAAHETIPGHHIQRGIQRQLKGVPKFRKAVPFTAFADGWAMYAEQLSWEKNLAKDPYDNLGRLQMELWRAVRLVVDTGIHYKRWTREQALNYMAKTTGMPENTVEIEIDRYIVDPGQACAYKIGMLKFLELRQKARMELGEKFDIKEFHTTVLKNGAMPLEILEQQVDKYIKSKSL